MSKKSVKKNNRSFLMNNGIKAAIGVLSVLLCAVMVMICMSVGEANDNFDTMQEPDSTNQNENALSPQPTASSLYTGTLASAHASAQLPTGTPAPTPAPTPVPTPTPTVTPEPTPVNLEYPYEIVLDKSKQVVTIYTVGEEGYYDLMVKQFICSTGKEDKVVDGMYRIQEQYEWRKMENESYAQYASRISGPFLFHSCTYYEPKKNKLRESYYVRLGRKASSGCVRMLCGDAYWIYENCPVGTPIHVITSGEEDPELLEKLQPPEVRGGWDPTDPDPKNPYRVTPAPDTTPDPTPALGVTPAPTPEWTLSPELKAWGK